MVERAEECMRAKMPIEGTTPENPLRELDLADDPLPESSLVRLEHGLVDRQGVVHRELCLRPSRARDEVRAAADFRARLDPSAFTRVLLARVLTFVDGAAEKQGSEGDRRVDAGLLEQLAPGDLARIVEAYEELNGYRSHRVGAPSRAVEDHRGS
jgi:hypothetical protein